MCIVTFSHQNETKVGGKYEAEGQRFRVANDPRPREEGGN